MPYEQVKDPFRPESLLPLKISESQARDLIRAWYGRQWLAPNIFSAKAITDTVKGIYLPYWTFDAKVDARWTAESGEYYYVQENNKRVQRVNWRPASGQLSHAFNDELVCASVGVDSARLRQVEPFPTETLVPFDAGYLAGWTVERYQIDLVAAAERSREQMDAAMREMCGQQVPGDTHRNLVVHATFSDQTFKHILAPLWLHDVRLRRHVLPGTGQRRHRHDCRIATLELDQGHAARTCDPSGGHLLLVRAELLTGMIDPRLSSALADRYRLERELGAGGMATVYLADDLKHQRKVAVKVLRSELSATLGHERFLREITTTANLRHPHILPLFDSGGGAGFLYYVMPYVDGESLRDRLRRTPQIPIDEALRIADEVADALSYAHRRGVIHRDIKPENILLENGHAIVADFGIAHAVTSSGDDSPTMTGMVVGTPKYMSPEQAREDVVDERSDLYALGCVVYEMLSGTPPFTGPTAMAVITRHALDPVPSVRASCPTLAVSVGAAVERALAKTPADRFASIDEWRRALMQPTVAMAPPPPTPSIFKPPPSPATPLLGRDETLGSAADRLRGGVRVLTVTGPGGTGKTRFAIELLRRMQDTYPDGAAFVSIASVTAAADVMPTVGVVLDIAEAHGRSALDAVSTVIGDRRVLLLLDNLEQVLDAAGDIAALVARCPALQIVVTSRAPLKIGAETELALPPLEVPAADATSVEQLMQSPAVALFAQRAQKVQPAFAVSAENGTSIAAIVRRLDGLPLALELAAARIRILEPAVLLQRLDHALDLLTSGDRDLPARQRTLRATIDWSYSLLDAAEQRLLRRASVFSEGWTLEAMEAVCYAEGERHRALDELDSLVEKGLVRVVGSGERYLLLETIRAFAAEQLDAAGEAESVRQAHADYYLELAGIVYQGIMGDGQLDAMRRGRADTANTFSAIHWLTARARAGDAAALENGMLLCGRLGWFWHIVGLHLVARGTVDTLLALATDRGLSRGRALARFAGGMVSINTGEMERGFAEWSGALADARALGDAQLVALNAMGMGYIHLSTGRMDEARAALDESIERSRAAGSEFLFAFSTAIKGLLHFVTGDLDGGIALVEQARTIQIRLEDYEGLGLALSFLAQMHFAKGDHARALQLYRDALTAFAAIGDRPEIARVQCELGWAALAHADIAGSRQSFRQALRSYDEVGSPRGVGLALMGLAAADAADGRTERAVLIAAAAHVMSEKAGVVVEHPMAPGVSDRIEALKASISRADLDSLVASGRALSSSAVLAMVAD